jgi:hypothetical protein
LHDAPTVISLNHLVTLSSQLFVRQLPDLIKHPILHKRRNKSLATFELDLGLQVLQMQFEIGQRLNWRHTAPLNEMKFVSFWTRKQMINVITCVKNCPLGFSTLRDFSITSSRNCHSLFCGLIDNGISVKSENTKSNWTFSLFSLSNSARQSPTMIWATWNNN